MSRMISPRGEKIAKASARTYPNGDDDMKKGGYTFSARHR
jgi:hypothetical protein